MNCSKCHAVLQNNADDNYSLGYFRLGSIWCGDCCDKKNRGIIP